MKHENPEERLQLILHELKRRFEQACRERDLCRKEHEEENARLWHNTAHDYAHMLRVGFDLIPEWNAETKTAN